MPATPFTFDRIFKSVFALRGSQDLLENLAMEGEMSTDGNLERIYQLMDDNPRIAEAHKQYMKAPGGDSEALKLGLLRNTGTTR